MRQPDNHKANRLRQMCMCENTSPIYGVGGNTVKLMHIHLLMLSTAKNTASKQNKKQQQKHYFILKGFFFMRDSII